MTDADIAAIIAIADKSAIASYNWHGRGHAPAGYTRGMALTFAQTCARLKAAHPGAIEMAKANTHNDRLDALAWYNSNFAVLGMSNDQAGADTLRHLFALMMGHGMLESSGQHCCGRDRTASNVTSDTAEAGLFQTSYNAHVCHPAFDHVMDDFHAGTEGFAEVFAHGVTCSPADWADYGAGRGAEFQHLCKTAPACAVETAAIVLRNMRTHYGPINRKEAELRPEADEMFRAVQAYVDNMSVVTAQGPATMSQPTPSDASNQSAAPAPVLAPAPWIVFDTNQNTFDHLDRIKQISPNVTIIRYIAAGLETHEKVIKQGEAHAIAEAGFKLGLVYEIDGRPNGAGVGARDGAAAKQQAIAVGAPQDGSVIIWYTDDQDRPESQMGGLIAAITAFAAALGSGFRVGIYGSGAVCDELWNRKLVAGRWITDSMGFRGSRESIAAGRYEIRQLLPRNQAGMDTDPDVIRIAASGAAVDIGDFVPFASSNIATNDKAD